MITKSLYKKGEHLTSKQAIECEVILNSHDELLSAAMDFVNHYNDRDRGDRLTYLEKLERAIAKAEGKE